MKFSYTLIQKLIPEIKSKKQVINALNDYAYEVEDLKGNSFDVKIPANRFSDSASHLGIAREISAILNLPFKYEFNFNVKGEKENDFLVNIKDKNLCPRYTALRFDNVLIEDSPSWLQKILTECGLRPINNIVDILNYVMLLTGEPMHAFDFDKLAGHKIIVRRAKQGESILTLDGEEVKLNENILVIADSQKPVAIAGIKGGAATGIDKTTKRILVEAANFEPSNIYKTYKAIGLPTDAALRFSHELSLNLPLLALKAAEKLILEIAKGKKCGFYDSLLNKKVNEQKVIKFDIEKFNHFIGINLEKSKAELFLKRLGFKKVKGDLWQTPPLRLDILEHEDVFEEVARLYGYNFILPQMPEVSLLETQLNDEISFKEKIRKILIGFGVSETFNYSFVSQKDLENNKINFKDVFELLNPISEEFKYLRPNLSINLTKAAFQNLKFFETVKLFELGNVFLKNQKEQEIKKLGIVIASKKENKFFELKGILDELFEKIGLEDFNFVEDGLNQLKIVSENNILGEISHLEKEFYLALAEINFSKLLTFVQTKFEFQPLPKFPLVWRDISFFVSRNFKIGDIIQAIYNTKLRFIENVELIDEYLNEHNNENQSLTLRIVLNPQDHTFTKEEVDQIINKIITILQTNFKIKIR